MPYTFSAFSMLQKNIWAGARSDCVLCCPAVPTLETSLLEMSLGQDSTGHLQVTQMHPRHHAILYILFIALKALPIS
jgi:hypothetical protein